jgi:hypothetical protein
MKLKLLCPILLLSVSHLAAKTSEKGWSAQSGNDILPKCVAAVDFMDQKDLPRDRAEDGLECLNYVAGYLDGFGSAQTTIKGMPVLCFPERSNTGEVVRVFVKWMRDHPEKLNEPTSVCLSSATTQAVACKFP